MPITNNAGQDRDGRTMLKQLKRIIRNLCLTTSMSLFIFLRGPARNLRMILFGSLKSVSRFCVLLAALSLDHWSKQSNGGLSKAEESGKKSMEESGSFQDSIEESVVITT